MGEANKGGLDGHTTIAAFLQETLTCQASACLSDVLTLCAQTWNRNQTQAEIAAPNDAAFASTHTDHLILVDHHHHPLGLVHLSRLISDVLLATATDAPHPLHSRCPLSEQAAAYLEPLLSVPATITLFQFWQQLQSIPTTAAPHWAIIAETTGAFLGLVDLPKLLHCLAHQSTLSPEMPWLAEVRSLLDPGGKGQGEPLVAPDERAGLPQPLQAKIADLTVLNHLNSALLAEVSHELKTPLTAIVGLSHVLKNPGLGALSDRQTQYVQLMGQKSQQLMRLVSDLLDYTQLQTHPLTLQPDVVTVPMLCQQAMAQAVQSYQLEQDQRHPHPIQLTLAPELPLLVADELRLRQILVALLRNAMGLAGAQDEIGLQVEAWGHWFTFTVWDTGRGIPPHQQHLVCNIPQTLDHREQGQLYSMGLGVILAQRLAQLQGGDITFVSEPNGNRFTLLLPSHPPIQGAQGQSAEPADHLLILVIAAAPKLIGTLTQQLQARGHQVMIARSGPEALEKARVVQPQMILLHLVLPLVSGWDVLTLLQHASGISSVPIVAMGAPHQRQQAVRRGAQAFLALPIFEDALDHSLDWVRRSQPPAAQSTSTLNTEGHGASPSPTAPTSASELDALVSALPSQAQEPLLVNLTVLHLDHPMARDPALSSLDTPISHHLHLHGCRVVATDDVEEAELLAQIWHPKVILYTSRDASLLHQLSRDSPLAMLPFVLLHPEMVNLGHQLPHLTIFACPLPDGITPHTSPAAAATLLQVLKVAASVAHPDPNRT